MTPEQLIQLSLGLPLVAVVLIYLFGNVPNVREACTITVASLLFWVTCSLAQLVFAGEQPTWSLGEMMPGFSIEFAIEPLGMVFGLVASGLWILTTIYAIGYMRGHHEKNQNAILCLFRGRNFRSFGGCVCKELVHAICRLRDHDGLHVSLGDPSRKRRSETWWPNLPWNIAFNISCILHVGDRLDMVSGWRNSGLQAGRNSVRSLRVESDQ